MTDDSKKKGPRRPKSPPAPRYDLRQVLENARRIYDQVGKGDLAPAEIASALGQSATSSYFQNRMMTLRSFGLIRETQGERFAVSNLYLDLRDAERGSAKFKRAANDAIRGVGLYRQLLDELGDKLPPQDTLASRLERDHGFNRARAEEVASVFEESLRFAELLDSRNHLLPPPQAGAGDGGRRGRNGESPNDHGTDDPVDDQPGVLTFQVPVEGGVVSIRYPADLSASDASKVAGVLRALTGDPAS